MDRPKFGSVPAEIQTKNGISVPVLARPVISVSAEIWFKG